MNSRLCRILVCVLWIGAASLGHARERRLHFQLGPQLYYHRYEEPNFMENTGFFVGVDYTLSYENRIYLGLEGLAAYGLVDYDSVNTGASSSHDDVCLDHRVVLGYKVIQTPEVVLMPYVGLGYRFLQDDSSNRLTSTQHLGYLRESNYYYSPVGFRMRLMADNGWEWLLGVEYKYFWSGTQESYLGYIAGYEDIENDQENGMGVGLSFGVIRQLQSVRMGGEVFFRHWDIEDSKVTTDSAGRSWIEPDNTTDEIGLTLFFFF